MIKSIRMVCLVVIISFLHGCAGSVYVPQTSERPALHQAALLGNVDEVRRLLPGVVDVNALDSSGFSALHWASTAAAGQSAEAVKLLLQAGANPDVMQSSAKMTPLFFASTPEIVNLLIDAGANIEFRAIDQSTPLYSAKSVDVLKALLARGANKDALNMAGNTAKEQFEMMLPYFEKEPSLGSTVKVYKEAIAILDGGTIADASTQVAGFSSASAALAGPSQIRPNIESLMAAQVCPMSLSEWIYTGELCVDGKAHGKGSAIHTETHWRFEGRIDAGLPVEGILFENDIQTYEGAFLAGLAHGNGVCYYQGAPEECRYFKGQRIDSLHKQRLEFERQQSLTQQHAQGVRAVINKQPTQAAKEQNTIGDAIENELLEQGAKFLFNQLF